MESSRRFLKAVTTAADLVSGPQSAAQLSNRFASLNIGASSSSEDRSWPKIGESGYNSVQKVTLVSSEQETRGNHIHEGKALSKHQAGLPHGSSVNEVETRFKSRCETRRKYHHIMCRGRCKTVKSAKRRGSSHRCNDTNIASGESRELPKTKSLGSHLTPGMTKRLSTLPLPAQFKKLDQMQWSDRKELIRQALRERSLTKLRPLIMALKMSKIWAQKSSRARPHYICMENDHGCFKAMKMGQPRLVTHDNLITHWLSVHFAGELLYSCSECGKRFKHKSSISEHKKLYHGAD